jgi:ATP synthase protein I
MNTKIDTETKWKAWVIWPSCVALLIASLTFLLVSQNAALAVILGAFAVILPQAVFGFFCFRFSGALNSQQIWKSFVRGEVLKLFLSAFICGLCFHFVKVNPLGFITSFILMHFILLGINCRLLNR